MNMIKYTSTHQVFILHQDFYQKLIECFSNYIPTNILKNILNEGDIDVVIDEICNNKDFQKSDTEIEAFEIIEELKHTQEYDDGGIIVPDGSNEKKINDSRVQAMFKMSRLVSLSFFIISQDYYELPKRTIRANGNIYHLFQIEHMLIVMDQSTHKEHFSQQLQTKIKQLKTAVTFLNGFNGIFNVIDKNNKFCLAKLVSDEDGFYTIYHTT